jgi:predicted N-formylglutamate amidohydrolase
MPRLLTQKRVALSRKRESPKRESIPVHGEMRGLLNTGIEIRQDLIGDQSGQRQRADRLARILREIEETLRKEVVI